MRTLFTLSVTLFISTMTPLATISLAQEILPASLTIVPAQLAKPAVQRPAPDVLVLPYLNPDGTVATPIVPPAQLEPAPEVNLGVNSGVNSGINSGINSGKRPLTPLSDSVPETYVRGHPRFVPQSRLP